mmetsp:Transcript_22323/g.55174  ORF Transcript_22323/g.55174 Transcript_22323/m.55174 type:complete len:409 (-) Transcript_22323:2086-3312(-)
MNKVAGRMNRLKKFGTVLKKKAHDATHHKEEEASVEPEEIHETEGVVGGTIGRPSFTDSEDGGIDGDSVGSGEAVKKQKKKKKKKSKKSKRKKRESKKEKKEAKKRKKESRKQGLVEAQLSTQPQAYEKREARKPSVDQGQKEEDQEIHMAQKQVPEQDSLSTQLLVEPNEKTEASKPVVQRRKEENQEIPGEQNEVPAYDYLSVQLQVEANEKTKASKPGDNRKKKPLESEENEPEEQQPKNNEGKPKNTENRGRNDKGEKVNKSTTVSEQAGTNSKNDCTTTKVHDGCSYHNRDLVDLKDLDFRAVKPFIGKSVSTNFGKLLANSLCKGSSCQKAAWELTTGIYHCKECESSGTRSLNEDQDATPTFSWYCYPCYLKDKSTTAVGGTGNKKSSRPRRPNSKYREKK